MIQAHLFVRSMSRSLAFVFAFVSSLLIPTFSTQSSITNVAPVCVIDGAALAAVLWGRNRGAIFKILIRACNSITEIWFIFRVYFVISGPCIVGSCTANVADAITKVVDDFKRWLSIAVSSINTRGYSITAFMWMSCWIIGGFVLATFWAEFRSGNGSLWLLIFVRLCISLAIITVAYTLYTRHWSPRIFTQLLHRIWWVCWGCCRWTLDEWFYPASSFTSGSWHCGSRMWQWWNLFYSFSATPAFSVLIL